MKTHFAMMSAGNENDPDDDWSDPICGTHLRAVNDLQLSNDWEFVDCKICLKRKERHEQGMKRAMDDNINDMAGFVEFMEEENKKQLLSK
jgi:hypothetical protein